MASMFSETGASMSMLPFAPGPTMSLLMYISGVLSILPLGAAATAEIEPSCPFTSNCKPSMGSTARSASGPPVPSVSSGLTIPGWLLGALTRPFSSRRCSRRTVTLPETGTFSNSSRKASVAIVYARSESPDPSRRATFSATRSVTAAYSTAAEAMDPEWGSVTLMGSHRTSHTHQDRPHDTECSHGWVCVETVRMAPYRNQSDLVIIHQLTAVDYQITAPNTPPPPSRA